MKMIRFSTRCGLQFYIPIYYKYFQKYLNKRVISTIYLIIKNKLLYRKIYICITITTNKKSHDVIIYGFTDCFEKYN